MGFYKKDWCLKLNERFVFTDSTVYIFYMVHCYEIESILQVQYSIKQINSVN
jgi:hypothetical protein